MRNVSEALGQAGLANDGIAERMCRHLMASKSVSTVNKYYGSFRRWQSFRSKGGHSALPAEPILIAVYLTELLDSGSSHHVISSAVYGIKWAHGTIGFPDPTNNAFIKNLNESAKRTTGRRVVKKDAVSSDTIVKFCDSYVDNDDLLITRDLCMITTAFAGFLRFDELSSIRCTNITIYEDYLKLDIQKSKTDQYRYGQEVLISRVLPRHAHILCCQDIWPKQV